MSDFELFIGAILCGDLDGVQRHWREEYQNEIFGEMGGSALHWASVSDKNGDIVRFLVEKGCAIEAVDGDGWRPIQMAVGNATKGALRALAEAGCFLDDVTMREDVWVKNNPPWKMVDSENGETVLDKAQRSPRMMAALRAKRVFKQELDELISSMPTPNDPQSVLAREWLLYKCIRHGYQSGFVSLCSPDIVNRETLFMGHSALETAVKIDGDFFVGHILKQLYAPDEVVTAPGLHLGNVQSWNRAVAAAAENGRINISLILSERMSYCKDKKERGYSRLHIAVYDNDPDMVRYLLENKLCDADEGDKSVGTALSLAYSLGHMRCVRRLQNHKVNVNTVDRLGQSPLHVAIINRREDCCEYLAENTRDIDAVDYRRLSVLALAVMMDRPRICERIVGRMERVNQAVTIDPQILDNDPDFRMVRCYDPRLRITSNETIPSLCLKINGTIYPCLLNKIDEQTIDLTIGNNNTLLHRCAVLLLPVECHQLILRSASVTRVNDRRETPLLALINENHNTIVGVGAIEGRDSEFEMNRIKTVDVLIKAGSSVNVETSEGFTLFKVALEYNSEKLLLALIKRREHITAVKKDEWLSWFQMKYFVFIHGILPLIDKSLLSEWITEDIIKSHAEEADLTLIKALYDLAVINVQISVAETILYVAARNCNEALFMKMAVREISSKSSLAGGESLLHYLIREGRTLFCSILLLSRNAAVLIEKKDAENKLPLHVCIECDNWDIIDHLIRKTKSINEEDNNGHTPLSLLFVKMPETGEEETIERLMSYVRILINRSADIHKVNKLERTVISYCTRIGLPGKIKRFARDRQRQLAPEICSMCCDERVNCALACSHMLCMNCAIEGICSVCGRQANNKKRKLM